MNLFIDLETTGLPKTKGFCKWYDYTELDKYESSRIIEMGIVITNNDGETIVEYSSLVKPNNFGSLLPIITKITGITNSNINSEGIPIREVFDVLKKHLSGIGKIISYNIGFDMNILLSELHRINDTEMIDMINNIDHECAMELSKQVLKLDKFPKLCNLYKDLFKKESKQEHRALSDTHICKDVYFELKKRQEENNRPPQISLREYVSMYRQGCDYYDEEGDPFDPDNAANWDGDQQIGFRD
jgi:DNA polymerase III epsilon subunit-like protein|tara:strand:- start:473 stop:1201 length:729 start_codon:yes stop_codon:yes gene_type:complete